jgi:DNA-binding IclR family transcriptional regulator
MLGNQRWRPNVRDAAKPYLIQLMENGNRPMAMLDGDQVLYLEKVEGVHALRMPSRVGRRIPTYPLRLAKRCCPLGQAPGERLLRVNA